MALEVVSRSLAGVARLRRAWLRLGPAPGVLKPLAVLLLLPVGVLGAGGRVELEEPDRADLLAADVVLRATVEAPAGVSVESVRFRVNGRFLSEDLEAPFEAPWSGMDPMRDHLVRVTVAFADGTHAYDLLSIPVLGLITRTTVTGDAPDLVLLSVTVTDRKDEPITDLRRDEVLVFEDGRRQKLEIFEPEERPLAVQLLLDASDSTESQWADLARSTRLFAETLRPGDRAGVEAFSHLSYELAPLGSPASRIEDATAGFKEWGGATRLYDVLSRAALFTLGREPAGRKAVILLTDGSDSGSVLSHPEARDYLQRAGIQAYSIVWHQENWTATGTLQRYSVGSKGHQIMERLTLETGGAQTELARTPMEEAFLRIGERLRSQYLVGYTSLSRRARGKERDIEVRLRRSGTYTVRYPRSHFGGQSLGDHLAHRMSRGNEAERQVAIRAATVNQETAAVQRLTELLLEEKNLDRGPGLEVRLALLRLGPVGVPYLRDQLDADRPEDRQRIQEMLADVFIVLHRSRQDAALEESLVMLGGGDRRLGREHLGELLATPLHEESRRELESILAVTGSSRSDPGEP